MTDWNKRYADGDTPWTKATAAPPLIEIFQKKDLSIWGNAEILLPGCGVGNDVRAIAAKGLPARGLDIAPLALSAAEAHPTVASEKYELGDFLDPAWQSGRSFSAIWEHTCFCAIPPSQRPAYAAAAAKLILPGGHLIGVFFLTPNEPHELDSGPPFNSTIEEIDSLFANNFERIDSWVPEQFFPAREGKEWTAIYRRQNSQPS